jgi:regulator-associated protein of mTOR
MTALSVHQRIPLVATGSHEQFIKVMTLDGYNLQVIRYHEVLTGRQIGPVSCLEFHPHKPILAAGGTDSIVSIYSPKNASTDR